MFGLWIWVPPERGQRAVKTAERMVLHTHLYSVQVARGPRTPAAVIRRRAAAAARKLEKAGVRRVVLPDDFAYGDVLEKRGIGAVDTLALRRELAAEQTCRGLEDRGLSGGTVAVSADAMSAELVRTVTELSLRCRYVLLDVPYGGPDLAGRLRREYGVALRLEPDLARLGEAEALVLFAPRTDLHLCRRCCCRRRWRSSCRQAAAASSFWQRCGRAAPCGLVRSPWDGAQRREMALALDILKSNLYNTTL